MDVVNKAKDVINKISSDVSKKAKEASGVSKMNVRISENERKIRALYMEIGKYVYENLREDAPDEIAEKMTAIDVAKKEVKSCKDEIMRLKGFQICEQCKSEVAVSAAFCPACGQKMPEPVVDVVDEGEVKEVEKPEEETVSEAAEVVEDVVENVVENVAEAVETVVENVEEAIEKTEE